VAERKGNSQIRKEQPGAKQQNSFIHCIIDSLPKNEWPELVQKLKKIGNFDGSGKDEIKSFSIYPMGGKTYPICDSERDWICFGSHRILIK
jgi:hypothetical protein